MRLPKTCKIEKACESMTKRGAQRPVLQHPYLRVEDGKGDLWATDSFKAVRIPVELDEGDTPGVVPVDAVKASRHASNGQSVSLNGDARLADGRTFPRAEDVNFPNLEGLMVARDDSAPFIGLSAKLLYELAQAMGTDIVRLQFMPNSDGSINTVRAIRVDVLNGSSPRDAQPEGLLMPVREK